MSSRELRRTLLRATAEAKARHLEARAEIDRRTDPTPRPGDVFVFPGGERPAPGSTAGSAGVSPAPGSAAGSAGVPPAPGLWGALQALEPAGVLLEVDAVLRLSFTGDIAIPAESACGAMTLRCGFEVRCGTNELETAKRTGCLDPEDLERARHKRVQIETGALVAGRLAQETDTDPVYQDWLEEGPARARAALVDRLATGEDLSEDDFYVDGVDGSTGEYRQVMRPSEIAEWAREERIDPDLMRLLQHVHHVSSQPHLGLPAGADPRDLATTGWALVVAGDESPAVREALEPLLRHRRQTAADKALLLEYRPGESWRSWLSRHGLAPGRVQPSKVPHYLLLAGEPARIPFDFQSVLGVEYAVGRLSFETPEEYRRYADSLIRHETAADTAAEETAVFFAPRLASDPFTAHTADIVAPWADVAEERGFGARSLIGDDATKAALSRVLHPPSDSPPPALFVGASQGLTWPTGHPERSRTQGALVCQDWPAAGGIDPERHGFGGPDLGDDARVHGMVAVLYASYSAGTSEPSVAGLPRRLLGHPAGGAASVVGLLGQVHGAAAGPREATLGNLVEALLSGSPVGQAVWELKKRYAALSVQLRQMRRKMRRGAVVDDVDVAAVWSLRNEVRDLVVLGDPAVRLHAK